MGQAKARGSREERIKAAQEREAEAKKLLAAMLKEREEVRRRALEEKLAAMTPEQREDFERKEKKNRLTQAQALGLMVALGLSSNHR